MDGGGAVVVDEALVAQARDLLAEPADPVAVFAVLAARTGDGPGSVWAVCLALGIPAAAVARRLGSSSEELLGEFAPGEETELGEFLELLGCFDVPRSLDAREAEVLALLNAARRALGGVGSGVAHSLHRKFVTGELTSAFLLLARVRPRPQRGDAAAFWEALVAAGALLPVPEDGETAERIAQTLAQCRERAAEAS
ncbi:hypothetical protein ACFVGY_23230 [Streptomyces sp. NPDC127106]|uniref:hypothetical protein n=1 Tax=Streptomyces sp. NPDC127106 TaxID=3345360 RepID=UPI0036378326